MNETALTIWEKQTPVTEAVDRLWSYLPSIASPGYNLDSFSARLAVQVMKQPNIVHAKPETVIDCLTEVAELGLTLGSECNLVVYGQDPRKMECSNLIEYQAWMRKFREIPGVDDVVTEVVYSNDHFKYDRVNRRIEHDVDDMNPNRGNLTHAYAIIYWLDPRKKPIIEVLDKKAVDRHRARARQGGNTPAWNNSEPEMWRKSAMQALARRYGRSLGGVIGGMAERDERTEYLEYSYTEPDAEVVKGYKDDLFGERPEPERAWPKQNVAHPPMREPQYVDVNPVTGELADDEPSTIEADAIGVVVEEPDTTEQHGTEVAEESSTEKDNTDWGNHLLKIKNMLNEYGITTQAKIKQLIENCGGDPGISFMQIRDHGLLDRMVIQAKQDAKGSEVSTEENKEGTLL